MNKLDVTQLECANRRVLLRADLDVPIDMQGHILDDRRIRIALPTIRYLIKRHAKIVIIAHLGRPEGVNRKDLSLKPIASRMDQLLNHSVAFASNCIGSEATDATVSLKKGDILVLENLRFHTGEEANSSSFAQQLAELGDEYVNDAFGASIRSHASMVGISKYFVRRAAGIHMINEISRLEDFLSEDKHPFVLIIGGDKKSKLSAIQNLLGRIDVLLIGGANALACLKAVGFSVGTTEDETVEIARDILNQARLSGAEVILPTDFIVRRIGSGITENRESSKYIQPGWKVVDIGPQTRAIFSKHIMKASCLVWGGPMGIYEIDAYIDGTLSIAKSISKLASIGVSTIVGGGDTAAALKKLGLESKIGYLSVAGGSMLSFLAGNNLPGIEALTNLH